MSFVMSVNGTDISNYIESGGFEWSRNDIDASGSGRSKDGVMRRKRIASKDKITVKCRPLNSSELSTVAAAISGETVSVTYLCPASASVRTSTFYGSSIKSATVQDLGSTVRYSGASFSLIEV